MNDEETLIGIWTCMPDDEKNMVDEDIAVVSRIEPMSMSLALYRAWVLLAMNARLETGLAMLKAGATKC